MRRRNDVDVRAVTIDGPHGPIDARLYGASKRSGVALVWLHGGGWVGGDLDMPEADFVARILAAGGVTVLSAEYRKAIDGVRYPVPSDDALAAWRWGAEHLDGERISFGGASAGANLAVGATKRARDYEETLPASLVLAYPLLHAELPPYSDELDDAMQRTPSNVFTFARDDIPGFTRNYVGAEALFDDPYAFPANGDLSRLPRTYIVNGEHDSIRASGEAFAAALRDDGVEVLVETEPGTGHGHLNDLGASYALRSLERIVRWLREPAVNP